MWMSTSPSHGINHKLGSNCAIVTSTSAKEISRATSLGRATGANVEIVNADPHFHMLRGQGAGFFSLPFAASTGPSLQRLDRPGTVELSSGSFFFWMHGYLLVADHPYFARTNALGRFTMDKVPAGQYEVVSWMPNWHIAKSNRDPETGLIIQVDFEPPVEQVRKLTVRPREVQQASFVWSEDALKEPRTK